MTKIIKVTFSIIITIIIAVLAVVVTFEIQDHNNRPNGPVSEAQFDEYCSFSPRDYKCARGYQYYLDTWGE